MKGVRLVQYFVDLGEHVILPSDPSTWTIQLDWDALQHTDGTKIVALWARYVSGTTADPVKHICPIVSAGDVTWEVRWTVAGNSTATWALSALVSDQVTQP